MTRRQRDTLVLGLGSVVALIITIAIAFGILPEEVGIGGPTTVHTQIVTALATEDPLVPTTEFLTPSSVTQSATEGCEILVGHNYLSEQPEEVESVPVYYSIEAAQDDLAPVAYLQPGDEAHISAVLSTNNGIWAHIILPVTGFVEAQTGFFILDYPECAALLAPESPEPLIPTPTTGVTPTPLVVGCFVANVAPYPLNLRLGASTSTPIVGELASGDEIEVISGTRSGWLRVKYGSQGASLGGWLTALVYSASCDGVID